MFATTAARSEISKSGYNDEVETEQPQRQEYQVSAFTTLIAVHGVDKKWQPKLM